MLSGRPIAQSFSVKEPVDILLVDDRPVKLLALDAALAPLGERLSHATSGREALRLLLDRDFAVILLDVNMPIMDGFETAELIRGRDRSAHTPIIFISAVNQTQAHAVRGYRLGAVDYVNAPIVPDVIRAKVSVFVELHRKTLEAHRQAERIRDSTRELAEAADRLRHAERLAALGTLAAGLGHDMGNLLLPVRFHLESIAAQPVPPPVREDVAAVMRCTQYLQRLVHGLRMLSLDGDDEAASAPRTDLARWWADMSPVFRGCLPRGVMFEADEHVPPMTLRIPEHHLSQVVFNLVQNAGDALRARSVGRVRVWTREVSGATQIGVSDDGPGLSDEVKARCFEPFFTTKTRGISTGLGLSLVRTLVTRAGGGVSIDSREGDGCTFILTLPSAPREASPDGVTRPAALVSVTEPRMAGYVGALLGSLGYSAAQGSEPDGDGVRVWVTECQRARREAIARFCDGDPARRVVVIGPWPPGADSTRVFATGEDTSPAAIRRTVRGATGSAYDPESAPHASADPSSVRGRHRDDRRSAPAPVEARAGS